MPRKHYKNQTYHSRNMYNSRSIETLGTGDWAAWAEKAISWVSKALIGVLTWQAVQLTNTINSSSMQIMRLDAGQEIIRHDIGAIQKDIDKIQVSIEKINDKMK